MSLKEERGLECSVNTKGVMVLPMATPLSRLGIL